MAKPDGCGLDRNKAKKKKKVVMGRVMGSIHCVSIYIYIHSEGDQPWDFFGRNDAKAETPVLWPPHAKS